MKSSAFAVLAASIIGAFGPRPAERCQRPDIRVRRWAAVHSPRLPGFELRVPPGFTRDSGENSYHDPQPSGSRWADSVNDQLVVHWVKTADDHVLLGALPASEGQPEYSKCVEQIHTAAAEIVSYNQLESVGEGYAGPYQIHARLRWPDGVLVEVYGMASNHRRHLEILAAVRTIRRTGS
jgi:hypothetical protein